MTQYVLVLVYITPLVCLGVILSFSVHHLWQLEISPSEGVFLAFLRLLLWMLQNGIFWALPDFCDIIIIIRVQCYDYHDGDHHHSCTMRWLSWWQSSSSVYDAMMLWRSSSFVYDAMIIMMTIIIIRVRCYEDHHMRCIWKFKTHYPIIRTLSSRPEG